MLDFDNLDRMIAEKYISVQKHPDYDLYIYNYTQRAQFDRVWNNETLQCRGLIMDSERNIVSRPFRKFFNYGELTDGQKPDINPAAGVGDFTVTEKMDGSLGISYFVHGKMYIATRGSFTSDQAKWANNWARNSLLNDPLIGAAPNYTYLFEIIYPENRIVVNYGDRKELVLLTIVVTATGEELPYHTVQNAAKRWGISVVPRYDGITDFTKIEQKPNSEGYVIHYPETGLRFKIKFDEYVRLHKILTGINAKRIWEILSAGESLAPIIDKVPDEFYAWVQETTSKLETQFQEIENVSFDLFNVTQKLPTRKDQALSIKDSPYRGVVFNMLDGKSYDQIIWKMIEPAFETPFKVDEA